MTLRNLRNKGPSPHAGQRQVAPLSKAVAKVGSQVFSIPSPLILWPGYPLVWRQLEGRLHCMDRQRAM
ncbi:protein of unknown function [Hyphomicrobium sp. 1Nfss2.1]